MLSNFGDNLKRYRIEKNFSQQELAEAIGMHSTHVSRYERNLTAPSIDVVKKIVEVLDISIDTLIYGEENERAKGSINDSELLNMFAKVQQLPNKQKDTVKDFLSAFIFKTDLHKNLVGK